MRSRKKTVEHALFFCNSLQKLWCKWVRNKTISVITEKILADCANKFDYRKSLTSLVYFMPFGLTRTSLSLEIPNDILEIFFH